MLALGRLLPLAARDALSLRRARAANPGAFINSPRVSPSAILGDGVTVGELVVVGPGVEIGGHSMLNRGAIVASGKIGRFCSVAQFVHIGGDRHPLDHLSTSPRMYGPHNLLGVTPPTVGGPFPDPPVIGSDVWIGAGATINQGVTVGHGAVVGAGAVVTKHVRPFDVVAGVPAVLLKRRFPDDVIERLLDLSWWDWSEDKLPLLLPALEAGSGFSDFLPDPERTSRSDV